MVRRPRRRLLRTAVVTALSAALALPTVGAVAAPASAAEEAAEFKALVFSKTAGFRHDSIPTGIATIQALGAANDFEVDATENADAFTDANLAQYDVVIWLSTTGDVLNASQQAAFERYIQNGGGYAGVHAASDTEYDRRALRVDDGTPTPSTTGRGTASWSVPTSPTTRPACRRLR